MRRLRYLAVLHGDRPCPVSAATAARATGLHPTDVGAGMSVWSTEPPTPIGGGDDIVFIIGKAFTKARSHRAGPMPPMPAEQLTNLMWGPYVAILRQPDGKALIMREPSGAVPSYFHAGCDGTIFASDVQLLQQAIGRGLHIDRFELIQHIARRDRRSSSTALATIGELLPGFAAGIDGVPRPIWSPWDFASPAPSPSVDAAAVHLRELVDDVVAQLVGSRGKALVGVSGGLDSSIVAAALAQSGIPLQLFTMYGADAEGDERDYARALARSLETELVEVAHSPATIDLGKPASALLPRPTSWPFVASFDDAATTLCTAHGCDVAVRGSAGDALFCDLRTAGPVADRLLATGPDRRALQTLLAMAQITGASVPRIALLALRKAMRARTYRWPADLSFLTTEAAGQVDHRVIHPWLVAPRGALPGKLDHIGAILRVQSFLDVHAVGADVVAPLYTQPIIEFCLRLPTYWWVADGRDRGIARRAYDAYLPPFILNRTVKGGPDGTAHALFALRRDEIRAHLLDGYLAQQGIVDCNAVRDAFEVPDARLGPAVMRLLALSDAEAWCRIWTGLSW